MRRFPRLVRHLGMGGIRLRYLRLLTLVVSISLVACSQVELRNGGKTPQDVVERATRSELVAFTSEAELGAFLDELARARKQYNGGLAAGAKASCIPATCQSLGCGVHPDGCGGTVNCGSCEETSASPAAEEAPSPAVADAPAESITNVQHAGVDEGGIVKLVGKHLVVLRRGRLFSISTRAGELRPVSQIDAFAPGLDPSGTWYDEMLTSGRTIVVIGYSYDRGGTEVGLFDIDPAGKLAYRATYHLRSNDYYSSRNYASRLIGTKLIFYAPSYLDVSADRFASFPALRKWKSGAKAKDFGRIFHAEHVYRPLVATSSLALHTVTVCDLGSAGLTCDSNVVMGPAGRVFYVSPKSVYVWVTNAAQSLVYRMPLDGSEPTAVRAFGSPVDQFSFLEDEDEHLDVLLRADAAGDGMWSSEITAGDVALFRVPLDAFSTRPERAPQSSYRRLPSPRGDTFQNRFVGDFVLYGTGNGWGEPSRTRGTLIAHRFRGQKLTARLAVQHSVDRIEVLGSDAIVIGSTGRALGFSPVSLLGRPWIAEAYTRGGASQGELRSHGFFYRSDGPRSGIVGLPIREPGRPGYEHLFQDSASVLFVKHEKLGLRSIGTLESDPETTRDDGCRASCVDWYGNARPLFIEGRVFALLGYELVEGELRGSAIREKRRVGFAPVKN